MSTRPQVPTGRPSQPQRGLPSMKPAQTIQSPWRGKAADVPAGGVIGSGVARSQGVKINFPSLPKLGAHTAQQQAAAMNPVGSGQSVLGGMSAVFPNQPSQLASSQGVQNIGLSGSVGTTAWPAMAAKNNTTAAKLGLQYDSSIAAQGQPGRPGQLRPSHLNNQQGTATQVIQSKQQINGGVPSSTGSISYTATTGSSPYRIETKGAVPQDLSSAAASAGTGAVTGTGTGAASGSGAGSSAGAGTDAGASADARAGAGVAPAPTDAGAMKSTNSYTTLQQPQFQAPLPAQSQVPPQAQFPARSQNFMPFGVDGLPSNTAFDANAEDLQRGTSTRNASANLRQANLDILGSWNALPTVNASNGVESLSTVLPGLASSNSLHGQLQREASAASQVAPLSAASSKSAALLSSLGVEWERPAGVPEAHTEPRDGVSQQEERSQNLSDMDRFGLKALLGVLRMEPNDRTAVAIGSDVTHMGLNISNSKDKLTRTFASPWVETSKHCVIPKFTLPECYKVRSVVPQQQKLQNLSDETLFYIFYTMPKDAMQEAVAVELTNRNWRYHKELRLWLTKDPLSEPIQQSNQAESGIYIFFDPYYWEKVKREYILYYPDIA